jgi:hypothetical protein
MNTDKRAHRAGKGCRTEWHSTLGEKNEFLFRSNAYYTGTTTVESGASPKSKRGMTFDVTALVRSSQPHAQCIEDFRADPETGETYATRREIVNTVLAKQYFRTCSKGTGFNVFLIERTTPTEDMPLVTEVYEGEGAYEFLQPGAKVKLRIERFGAPDKKYVMHKIFYRECDEEDDEDDDGDSASDGRKTKRGDNWKPVATTEYIYACDST